MRAWEGVVDGQTCSVKRSQNTCHEGWTSGLLKVWKGRCCRLLNFKVGSISTCFFFRGKYLNSRPAYLAWPARSAPPSY